MATMSLQSAYDLARQYLESNRVDQAIGVAHHILEHYPRNLEAHRILGEAYLSGRQFDQAEQNFGFVLASDPENISAHVGLGITYERQGKLDRAVTEFEHALEVRPDMPELRSQLLRLYTDVWGNEGATLRLSRPGLARLYAKGHMLPQAIQEFRSVLDDQPDRLDAWVGLAESLWRDNQIDAAAEVCTQILSNHPHVLKANLLLGYINLAAGDTSGEQYWHTAQQLEPYQGVAHLLFESLPDMGEPDLDLPEWDEALWEEQQALQEEARLAQEPVAVPVAAAEADEDLFGPSWLDDVDRDREAAPASVETGDSRDDDDFLANLLAFTDMDSPSSSMIESGGSDLDTSSGVVPFSPDDLGEPTPPDGLAPAESEGQELEPFSLTELGLSDDEIAELAQPGDALSATDSALETGGEESTPSADAGEEDAAELAPFSLDDLGLSPEEIAALEQPDALAEPGDAEPGAVAPEAQDVNPFSIDSVDAAVRESAVEQPADQPDTTDEPELTPFSLDDLGLSPEEIAGLESATEAAVEQPADQPDVTDEPELTPFSLDDLGLSPEEIAGLESATEAAVEQPADQPDVTDEPDLTPFSLDDLGLSPEEIAGLESATEAAAGSDESALDIGDMVADLEPFSLESLGIDIDGDEADSAAGSLPPSLQPFSLEDTPPPPVVPAIAPIDAEDGEGTGESGGYSWQQPSAKERSDFTRAEDKDVSAENSIFAKLRQRAGDLPQEEETPLPQVSLNEDDEMLGFFANDDDQVSLRDEAETSPAQERFSQGFRLPKDTDETPPAQPEDSADVAPAAEEPELTPFSLEELGLSPDEIAALSDAGADLPAPEAAAESDAPAAEEPELTPFSLEELGLSPDEIAALSDADADLPAPEAAAESDASAIEEPELTPFSLEELGLSPDEIAALNETSNAAATGDTIVPGWSPGEQPALTPFADEIDEPPPAPEPEASAIEQASAEMEPFDLGDIEGGVPQGDQLPADSMDAFDEAIEPFSLDDLGLGDFDTAAIDNATTRELGITEEDLAALDLGDLESIISDQELTGAAPPQSDMEGSTDQPDTGDPDLDRLIVIGRDRGYVELTDIINVVEDPEAEAERIEEMGWTLHRLGIQIRDGDEIIDLDADAEAEVEAGVAGITEYAGFIDTPEEAPAVPLEADEPELTPFSLTDLGLTEDEIAALGLAAEQAEPPPAEPVPTTPESVEPQSLETPAPPTSQPVESAEPELIPFSLEELGLSPEEIAALNAAAEEQTPPQASADTARLEGLDDEELFDFDIVDEQPVERVTSPTRPRPEEPPPAEAPEDTGFEPESLENMDDIWTAAPPEPEPQPAPPAPAEEPVETTPPVAPVPAQAAPSTPTAVSRDDARFARREAARRQRTRDDQRTTTARQRAPQPWPEESQSPARPAAKPGVLRHPAEFLPTGNNILDEYVQQLEDEPDNSMLSMVVGRMCAQVGMSDLMSVVYKRIIKDGHSIDNLIEEVSELIEQIDDPATLKQLHRILGDAYSKQGRFREAMEAYSATFTARPS
jgi:tetratricopeptide (TPR) repeat protein